EDAGDDLDGHSMFRWSRARAAHETREGFPLHVLHHHEELALEADDVEDGNDVGVAHAGTHPRFIEKHRAKIGVASVLPVKALDRADAREAALAHQPAEIHRRHAPRRDLAVEHVAADVVLFELGHPVDPGYFRGG